MDASASPGDRACGSRPAPKSFVPAKDVSTMDSSGPTATDLGSADEVLDILKIDPIELASQISILDQEVFLKISAAELTSCGWSKKSKRTAAPNIVAFTQRFNSVCMWTVREVLSGRTPKQRAKLVGHFVKTAGRLADLGNLHGSCAIISALQSTPVYRLADTWGRVSRKHRSVLDGLVSLFSERDNFSTLRSKTESRRGPCIPHLAPYLTDLLYAEMAKPEERRVARLEAIADRVLRCQPTLALVKLTRTEHLLSYFARVPYTEDLRKYIEDENYKLSLELEPPVRHSSASPTKDQPKRRSLFPVRSCIKSSSPSPYSGNKLFPEHRKENNMVSSSDVPSASTEMSVAGTAEGSSGRPIVDDGVPEDGGHVMEDILHEDIVVCQGCLHRKTVLKNGKKPAFSPWTRFWVALCGRTLVYYRHKPLRGRDRCHFRRIPCKRSCVEGWLIVDQSTEETESSEGSFQLMDPSRGLRYKFRLGSREGAREWCKWLSAASTLSKLPGNLM